MSTEVTRELRERAAVHGALADPARLSIVDALTLGDLSPSELQLQLGMSSNLMAHHLKVLEQHGLLVRARSEADRRRTYLRLVPESLHGVVPGGAATAGRLVFVCTANSARSQLAAALWRRASTVPVASAGTHPADEIDPRAVAVAARHGIALPARRPRRIDQVVDGSDVMVTVCDAAHEELDGAAALHWSVPDPTRVGTDSCFESVFADLAARVTDMAARVSPVD
jgi:protein-tyrosine-phosphatase/DNA-binding HxlR family transcriptional regulator